MNETSKYTTGIKWGIAGALVYIVLLYFRYFYCATDPVTFGGFASLSYIAILILFYFAARARKKQGNGFASFKEIFQSVLLTILITELGYALFNLIYLHFVNPDFFPHFKAKTGALLEKANLDKDKVDLQLSTFDNIAKQYTIANIVKGFGMWILIDCIFGVVYSSLLKKTKT